MPRNVYSEINLHFVWHTKNSDSMLTPEIEGRAHHYIHHRAVETKGVFVHAINGTENHVHLIVSIPPTVLISEWIGRLKGSSSHYINHKIANKKILDWQEGYGVVIFGTKDIEWVVRYVQNQKEHHARGATYGRLERSEMPDE